MVTAVHELTGPDELSGEVFGAVGDVQPVGETDADRAGRGLVDEVTVDRGDATLGFDRDEDAFLGRLAGLGLREPLDVLVLRSLVAEHDDFLAGELDVFDADRGQALLQDDGDFLAAAADGSDALDLGDALAADVEGAEVIAVEGEVILTVDGSVELGGPDHRESVLLAGLGDVDDAGVEVFHQRGLERREIRQGLPLALVHRAHEILERGLGRRERMGLEQLLGGPRGRALGGLGADGLHFVDGDRAGATGKALADIREHGGDLLVAEDGALGRHIDGVALAGDFDRTAEAVEHDLDGTRRSALGPLAAHEGRQAVESLAVGAVAGAAEGVIDLGAVFGGRHENGGSQEGEERRGAHKGYGLHQAPYFRRRKSDRNPR